MLLRLHKVRYKKGTEMFIADTHSRASLPEVGSPGNCLGRVDVEQVNASEMIRLSDDDMV